MISQINQSVVYSTFGEYYGKKLIGFLSECCQPRILIKVCATCAGLNPSGVQQYNVSATATYNTNIKGATSLIGYLSTNGPFPNWNNVTNSTLDNSNFLNATIFVNNITANVPAVSANLTVNQNAFSPGTYYAFVSDNRGNYSNLLAFNIPNCGNTPASSSSSTPASSSKSQPTG